MSKKRIMLVPNCADKMYWFFKVESIENKEEGNFYREVIRGERLFIDDEEDTVNYNSRSLGTIHSNSYYGKKRYYYWEDND